jgi:hypothetical protein
LTEVITSRGAARAGAIRVVIKRSARGNAGGAQGSAEVAFILPELGRVEIAVAEVEGVAHELAQGVAVQVVGVEAEDGDGGVSNRACLHDAPL